MPGKPYEFAIIGGDMRQLYLAEQLAHDNHHVCHYGLCDTLDDERTRAYDSLKSAVENAGFIIGPTPLGKFNAIINYLVPGQTFLAGCIPETSVQAMQKRNINVIDLMLDEPFAIYNSVATAEGAICEAITRSPLNLHGSQCAVLGYGRCGKTLAQYLKGMFCHIDVYTNPPKEQAEANIIVENVFDLEAINQHPGKYHFVFNTIPAQVIDAEFLKKMREQAVIIDIASAPGGIDYNAVNEYHVCACLCLGLPGKYATLSTAEAIANVINRVISKE